MEIDIGRILQLRDDAVSMPLRAKRGAGGNPALPRAVIGVLPATIVALEFHEIAFRRPTVHAGHPESRPGSGHSRHLELPADVPERELRIHREALFEVERARIVANGQMRRRGADAFVMIGQGRSHCDDAIADGDVSGVHDSAAIVIGAPGVVKTPLGKKGVAAAEGRAVHNVLPSGAGLWNRKSCQRKKRGKDRKRINYAHSTSTGSTRAIPCRRGRIRCCWTTCKKRS